MGAQKLLAAVLLALLGANTHAQISPTNCDLGSLYDGRCYATSGNYAATWSDARSICEANDMVLASLYTVEENDWAYQNMGCRNNGYGSNRPRGVCWIGLYQTQGETAAWRWVEGIDATWTHWATGEPNNVDQDSDGGEDCGQIWRYIPRNSGDEVGRWNDEPCGWYYPFFCTAYAKCDAGYYLSQAYERWTDTSLLPECSQCPGGTYRENIGATALSDCLECPAGTIGSPGRASICSDACPQGYYCPAGTNADAEVNSENGMQACPPGTYGPSTGLTKVSQCKACDPGYYCENEANTVPNPAPCDEGRCGFVAQTANTCTQACPAGYRCTAGSACPGATKWDNSSVSNTAADCGGSSVYCPAGSVEATPVDAGYYSTGTPEERSTGQTQCEAGYYCLAGVRINCPGGTYRAEKGAASEAECSACQAGYICPTTRTNTSPQSVNCHDDSFNTSLTAYDPAEVYCPAGSTWPLIADDGYYTTPETEQTLYNRRAQVACDVDEFCEDGLRTPKLVWSTSTACGTASSATTEVSEMSAQGTSLGTFAAQINGDSSGFDLEYDIGTVTYIDSSLTSCEPTTQAKNLDIFQVSSSSGEMTLTRDDLQFETCLPTLDIRYTVPVIATIYETGTTNVVSSIQCDVVVEVEDANDDPLFVGYNAGDGSSVSETIYYRQIDERVQKNVPVAVCDTTGYAAGCPAIGSGAAELLTTDEDDGSVLQYAIVSGDDGAASDDVRPFKIDPCTGLVSARTSDQIRYNDQQVYTYVISITDDGNGGRFDTKTASATLIIYVIDVNDDPVLTYDASTNPMYILENQPESTAVTGTSLTDLATDEDGDELTFQIVTNDGDAFKIVDNVIMTTRVGAETINYESSKKRYFLDIEVQDNRGGFAQGTIQIVVQDSNDAPNMDDSVKSFYVYEGDSDAVVCAAPEATCDESTDPGHVTATDEDEADDITFALTGNHTDKFSIDATTGVIRTTAALDFEDQSISLLGGSGRGYTLTVEATSAGDAGTADDAVSTAAVIVYVVDDNEAPYFSEPSLTIEIPETWPVGAELPVSIEAVDPDNADTVLLGKAAPQQTLAFSNSGTNAYFAISTNADGTGTIKVSSSLLGLGGTTETLAVRVQDNGGPVRQEATNSFTVTILDVNEAPYFSSSTVSFSADENAEFTSSGVYASDNDVSQQLTYSITGGNGRSFFTIADASSGALNPGFVVEKLPSATLNYELSSKEWTLNVQVADEGPSALIGEFCEESVASSCGDAGAYCLSGRCAETCYDTSDGTQASVYQANVGPDSFYRCEYGGATKVASINGESIALYVETADVSVVISIVDQNDPPKFTNCSSLVYQVVEDQKTVDQQIAKASVLNSQTYDEDAENSGSSYSRSWGFEIINDSGADYFEIESGALWYRGGSYADVVVGAVFTPTLRVVDSVDNSFYTDCEITVEVIEQNTAPSMADVTADELSEGLVIADDSEYVILEDMLDLVTDPDDDEVFTFTTSANGFFDLDASTGRLTVGGSVVSYEDYVPHVYELIVRVRDSKGAEDVATVTIPIGDVNEAPTFSQSLTTLSVAEDTSTGTVVLDASQMSSVVSDPDVYSSDTAWHTLSFTLESCTTSPCPFEVDATEGFITLTSELDFEGDTNQYTLVIRATDGGGLYSEGNFIVQVTNVNEAPVFTASLSVTVPEGTDTSGSALFNMKTVVEDPDAGDEPENLIYEILTTDSPFIIEDGVLTGSNNFRLDYEAEQSYVVEIQASDDEGLSATAEVTVIVSNLNDVRITSVTASGTLSCDGGSQVTISGSNFGLTDNTVAPATLDVRYTNTRTGTEYTCASPTRSDSDNTQITCSAPAGIGSGFTWTVSVTVDGTAINGDTSSSYSTPSLSYATPTVTQVNNATALPTRGGQRFEVVGTCMGSAADYAAAGGFASTPDTSVQYCSDASVCITPTDCAMDSEGRIACTSLPGLGGNLRWVVKIAGTTSGSFSSGSYAPPSITGVNRTDFPSDGDAPLLISGDNFGALGSEPDDAFALLTFGSATAQYGLLDCVVTTSYEEITCSGIEPGMGAGMSLYVEVGGQLNADSAFDISFAAPVVTNFKGEAVSGGSAVGGQQIVVEGSGFGPACGTAATNDADSVKCDILSAEYSRGSVRAYGANAGTVITYSPDCVIVTDSRAVCSTTAGTGAGHVWTFNFGGHTGIQPPDGVTTSYAVPTVGAYEGVGAEDALTSGSQEVLIRGSNFGPANGAAIVAYYGPEDDPDEFGGSSGILCEIHTVNEVIRCETVEGAGDELSWTVFVDGQESKAETTSYGDPEIAEIDVQEFDVDGGDIVTISGLNFGPQGRQEYLEAVYFGPLANTEAYSPTCTIRSHTELRCETPPGIGEDMFWTVVVKGQSSTLSAITTSYTPLSLLSTAPSSYGTEGGYLMRVYVDGLPICDTQSIISVVFGSQTLSASYYYDDLVGSNPLSDVTSYCASSDERGRRSVSFYVPELATSERAPGVGVSVSSRRFDGAYETALGSFEYASPILDSVYAEPTSGTSGNLRVVLRGSNFCRNTQCCQTLVNGNVVDEVSHAHTIIELSASVDGATVQIRCGTRYSEVRYISTSNPFTYAAVTSAGTAVSQVTFPTDLEDGTETISLYGLNYGSSTPTVYVGDYEATVIAHEAVSCTDTSAPSLGSEGECYRTDITVPSGQGSSNGIVVVVASGARSTPDALFEFVAYEPPRITSTSIVGATSTVPTAGGRQLRIDGTNFGVNGTVYLYQYRAYSNGDFDFETNPVRVGVLSCSPWDHSSLLCDIPPGEGVDLEIRVVAGDQDSRIDSVDPQFRLSYEAPIVTGTSFNGGTIEAARTIGGDLITIEGSNFGRPYEQGAVCADLFQEDCTMIKPRVALGGLTCNLVSNTHTEIVCEVPAGQGVGLSIDVTVRSQTTVSGVVFDYLPPTITSFTPLTAPTSGRSNGNAIMMEINGDNFGIDELVVQFISTDQSLELLVVESGTDIDSSIYSQFEYNHTFITFEVPEYYGKNLQVVVTVAGQQGIATELFSYNKPSVGGVAIMDPDDPTVYTDVSAGATGAIEVNFLPSSYVPGTSLESNRRRFLTSEAGSRFFIEGGRKLADVELRAPDSTVCDVASMYRGYSWVARVNTVLDDGVFFRELDVYTNEYCSGAVAVTIAIRGGMWTDSNNSRSDAGCATPYTMLVERVEMTPQTMDGVGFLANASCCGDGSFWSVGETQECACSALSANRALLVTGEAYGGFIVDDLTDLYFSEPAASLEEYLNQTAFNFPRWGPTYVSVDERSLDETPSGPTSGCWEFEAYEDYSERRDEAILLYGSALNVYRKCENKALMELTGDNFSTQILNSSNSNELEVVFVDEELGVEYRAATTSSAGDHNEPCLATDNDGNGCVHTHEKIIFQIPPGSGLNLLVLIRVGNQETYAEVANANSTDPYVRFNYLTPSVSRASPGTIKGDSYEFADAVGDETVNLRGDNFGGTLANTTIYMDGRICPDSRWRSPDEDLTSGLPFLSCNPENDAVGPRTLFVCVSNQATRVPASQLDPELLLEADRIRLASTTSQLSDEDQTTVDTFHSVVSSLYNARCKSISERSGNILGQYGGLGQLCVTCPSGAVCEKGDAPFTDPNAAEGYYRLDVTIFEDDGTSITDRAQSRCPAERWDSDVVAAYPAVAIDETCSDYVACQPAEACTGANECSEGYQYAYNKCNEVRGASGYNNSCGVYKDPFTGAYRGVDSDCNPDPTSECSSDEPENCAKCVVSFDGVVSSEVPTGTCECSMPQRCALCTLNTHYRLNNRCQECPDNVWVIALGFALMVLIAIAAGYYFNKYNLNLALLAIGIDFAQVLSVFSAVNLTWPPAFEKFLSFFSFLSLNIDIVGIECLVPNFEYETKWWLSQSLPLVVLAILIILHLCYSAYKVCRHSKRVRLMSHVGRLVAIYLVVCYVLYIAVTRKSLEIFDCTELPESDGYLYTSFTSLSCDGGSLCRCGEEGGIQQRLAPLAVVFLLVYTVGFPLFVFLSILRHRAVVEEDQYLRAHGVGDTRESGPRTYDFRKSFSTLYVSFKPSRQTWVVLVIMRKAFIAMCALLLRTNVTAVLAMVLLILFASFVLTSLYRPYMSNGERSAVLKELDELATKGLDDPKFNKYTVLSRRVQEAVKVHRTMLERQTHHQQGARRFNFDESDKTTSRIARRNQRRRNAAAFFFDYNSVELALLGSAILICLGGILLESMENDSNLHEQRNSLSALLIVLIVLSMVYYVIAVLSEVFPTFFSSYTKFLQRRKPDDHQIEDLDEDLNLSTNPIFLPGFQQTQRENPSMRKELEENQAELERIAEQNRNLRSELRRQKQEDQVNNDGTDGDNLSRPKPTRKQFSFRNFRSGERPERARVVLAGHIGELQKAESALQRAAELRTEQLEAYEEGSADLQACATPMLQLAATLHALGTCIRVQVAKPGVVYREADRIRRKADKYTAENFVLYNGAEVQDNIKSLLGARVARAEDMLVRALTLRRAVLQTALETHHLATETTYSQDPEILGLKELVAQSLSSLAILQEAYGLPTAQETHEEALSIYASKLYVDAREGVEFDAVRGDWVHRRHMPKQFSSNRVLRLAKRGSSGSGNPIGQVGRWRIHDASGRKGGILVNGVRVRDVFLEEGDSVSFGGLATSVKHGETVRSSLLGSDEGGASPTPLVFRCERVWQSSRRHKRDGRKRGVPALSIVDDASADEASYSQGEDDLDDDESDFYDGGVTPNAVIPKLAPPGIFVDARGDPAFMHFYALVVCEYLRQSCKISSASPRSLLGVGVSVREGRAMYKELLRQGIPIHYWAVWVEARIKFDLMDEFMHFHRRREFNYFGV
ncbi:Protocadherin-like protein [Hondaea fermentalgiana]|uniref:Protocadherin-like protein n=1 Tax=Hondaea fermentalgiana TaxID=2315210 RepID=A0A2R5G1F7_9STRA|nr:Protocadherin-like protein [Hondaea fermentalgiana]|eukprot:GBG24832.1 Protocadherin-like protein [Hondaea fermentalgiana]